jgi:hypothetical protein
MKTMRWIVLSMVALGATGWVIARAEVGRRTDGDSEVRALRQQVEQLQARLRVLEDRLATAESSKPGSPPRARVQPRSPGSPPAPHVPSPFGPLGDNQPQGQVWGHRDINGWTYYVIPCGGK